MAFTNVWDDTFPPDSQLANLLGQDLRNFRLDTQQRMAAISGLDASKPTFNLDAQPANWNGILFFATDTGKIYQFNNPSWVDITSSLRLSTTAFYKNTTIQTHTGTTTQDTIWTIPLPAMAVGNLFRVTFPVRYSVQGAGTSNMFYTLAATTNNLGTSSNVSANWITTMYLTPTGATTIQVVLNEISNNNTTSTGLVPVTVVNLNAQNLLIKLQSANNTDSQTLAWVLAEAL